MSFKKRFFRFWLRLSNRIARIDIAPSPGLTPNQELGIKIFEKVLVRSDVELLMAPLSSTYYIKAQDIFVMLDGTDLRIINGRYEYHITINEKLHLKLAYRFKRVLENKRKRMEATMFSKTNRSLNEILEDVSRPHSGNFDRNE